MYDSRTWDFARLALRNAVLTVLHSIVIENKKANGGRQVAVTTIGIDRRHEI